MRQYKVCKISTSEEISAYIDCMLDGRSMRRIARHIKACEDCRTASTQLVSLRESLRLSRKSPGSASEEFWANAFRAARLDDEASSAQSPALVLTGLETPRTRFSLRRVAALCAAAAVIIAAIAAPFSLSGHAPVGQPVEAAESVDIDAIVGSHAHATLNEPLVNRPRAVMIDSESTARQTGNTVDEAVFDIDQDSTDLPPAIH